MKKSRVITSICIFGILMFMVISGIVIDANNQKTKFSSNIYINGNNVRGYSVENATKIVADKLKSDIDGIVIKIKYQDKVWNFDESDFLN